MIRIPLAAAAVALGLSEVALAQLQVVSTSPGLNQTVAVSSAISIEFDRPLDRATVTVDSFRVFGRWTGSVRGSYAFTNGDRTVTLTPDDPFAAGEAVSVNLSRTLKGADSSSLRAEGYAVQFGTAVAPSSGTFAEIDAFSNRTGAQTRIYGASAADLNEDGYLDLATINEVSADVRVFLNRADGSGRFGPMLPRRPIGAEASPNESADFNNDGRVDLCVAAAISESVWILLGAGDGTFSSAQEIPVGGGPHGIATLDVDGDGDVDVVNANVASNDLSLLLNNGSGGFGAATFFDGGVNGEYGLAAADMDRDGITDLVVGGRNSGEIRTLLGNGDGTFTPAGPAQPSGGLTWGVVLGDLNGDGELDAVAANDGSGNVGVLLGQGDGTFGPLDTVSIGSHVPSTDLADLDGDGDLDMVVSSFGGGFWRRFENDGAANFSFVEDFPAPSNPSCAVLFDTDNDGDLDMALTDEIADVVVLMENSGSGVSGCNPSPSTCRMPTLARKSTIVLADRTLDQRDQLLWTWNRGAATAKADFGDPLATDDYRLCLYEDHVLVRGFEVPASGSCGGQPCWRATPKGFVYFDRELTPNGVVRVRVTEGIQGKAMARVAGKGPRLDLPALAQLTGTLDVQLQKAGGAPCWGATFTPPFQKNDGVVLRAFSDSPSAPVAPLWSAIHAQVVGPTCGSCHGFSGGLGGLADCNTGYASLVNVASSELPILDRVEPGYPELSWLMHKLDGTQGSFTAQCQGMFCGSQMPLGGALSFSVRDAIRAWIANGAVNDCP